MMRFGKVLVLGAAIGCGAAFALGQVFAASPEVPAPTAKPAAPAATTPAQHGATFATAKEGIDTFVAALRADDVATLQEILGSPEGTAILQSGDPVADRDARARFLAAYDEHAAAVINDPNSVTLEVGADKWPFPIPVVKGAQGWYFDTAAGKEELLARRIGRNELSTIEACKAFVDAQREYASADHGFGMLAYAPRFISTQGRKDGLYWPAKEGEPESPLGPEFVKAQARGYSTEPRTAPQPFNGYYFRILFAQGPAAKGGAYSYVVRGKMIGGYALVAYPATYGNSGIMTFMVNHDGVVFQKDLGTDTAAIASKMQTFDPGPGWIKA